MRGRWDSRYGFLLAAIGSAVGLGNIWRFPYICFKNGGGAFLLPYLIALLLVGIPLMLLEQCTGTYFQLSFPAVAAKIRKRWEKVGWWAVCFCSFGILLYYNVVISWCANFLFYAFNLKWGVDTEHFFYHSFLGLTSGPSEIGSMQFPIVVGTLFAWVAVWAVVGKGIASGIEKMSKIIIPVLFFQMAVLVVWSLFLPGAKAGIAAYLTPDPSRLSDPQVWSAAFSQIFFSLSLGFGIMVAYASYLPRKTPVLRNSLITCIANSSFEIFAGLAVFSVLGYMSFVSSTPVGEVVTGGPGLAFITYPKAISLLPFGQRTFAILFFSALLLAGTSSAISIFEAFISGVVDKFQCSRLKATSYFSLLGLTGSLVFTFGSGLYWLDIVDYFLNHFGLLLMGLLEAILIGWIFGASKIICYLPERESTLLRAWTFLVKYLTPSLLTLLIIVEVRRNISEPYGGYSWVSLLVLGCGWLVFTFGLACLLAKKAWVKEEPDEEGTSSSEKFSSKV